MVDRRQCRWGHQGRTDELLQETDVENVVQSGARQKLQAVGDVVDDGGDAVWSIVTSLELARCRSLQGHRGALAKA